MAGLDQLARDCGILAKEASHWPGQIRKQLLPIRGDDFGSPAYFRSDPLLWRSGHGSIYKLHA